MKRIVLILSIIMVLFSSFLSFATENVEIDNEIVTEQEFYQEENEDEGFFSNSSEQQQTDESEVVNSNTTNSSATNSNTTNSSNEVAVSQEATDVTPATQKILENSSKKDQKIAKYMEKYNDSLMANIAYWLDVVRLYSIPICIVGIAIGAFNFYIIGEKKLDKREKGFSSVVGFLCGLVFFQVLPLLFALVVVGR